MRLSILLLIMMLVAAGCGDREPDENAEPPDQADDQVVAADDEPNETSTPAKPPDPPDIEAAINSISAFGYDMFRGLAEREPDQNVITSPYSAAALLTLLLNGADGDTREAIGDVLHLEDPHDDGINRQHSMLAEYLITADPDVELAIANSLWANEGTPFDEVYKAAMADAYDATVEEIDLGSQEAVDHIDQWVSDQTRERINEMAEDLGVPDPNVVLILLNAVYFLGDWTDPFDPEDTREGTFTTTDGSEVEVPLMHRDDTHWHAQLDGYQVLRLPYGDRERFAMDILLPDEDVELNEFREEFGIEMWNSASSDLQESRLNVTLPRFELEYSTGSGLDDVLRELGMGIAYGAGADFTPMSSVAPMLSTVVQKTYIRVDEEGTEAAAVTGGAMLESAPPQFRADRPFMFIITDTETDAILFLGQVTDPSE